MATKAHGWDWEISAKPKWSWNPKPLVQYRHLLWSLVRRDFLINYQQTILGPLWILVQPLLTLFTFVLVFDKLIRIPVGENLPPVLFYFSGIVLWSLFNDSFLGTATTFRDHIHIFSKVYFPRIIVPISVLITQLVRFGVQMVLLVLMILYYAALRDFAVPLQPMLLAVPVAVLLVSCIGFSMGLIFSVLTAKYRDISNLVYVGIRLLMFVTPVIYPLSVIQKNWQWIVVLNPLTSLFELFRAGLFGQGTVNASHLLYSVCFAVFSLGYSVFLFHRQGARLIDIV